MKTLTQNILLLLLPITVMCTSGCATTAAYKHNTNAAKEDFAYRSGDEQIITSYHNGDVRGVGVNITAIDSIFRTPGAFFLQLGAALLDAAIGYGAISLLEEASSSNDSRSSSTAGRDNTIITTNGSGNDVTINNSQGSSITPARPVETSSE